MASLAGLGCGVGYGLYLLLILHAVSVTRGIWHNLLVVAWPVHIVAPVYLTIFVIARSIYVRHDDSGVFFTCFWALPALGAMIWYGCTHAATPLRLDRRKREE